MTIGLGGLILFGLLIVVLTLIGYRIWMVIAGWLADRRWRNDGIDRRDGPSDRRGPK